MKPLTLLTIPLATLRQAVQLMEKRESLVRELTALVKGKPQRKHRTGNPGVTRYWREWRKRHKMGKESNAKTE